MARRKQALEERTNRLRTTEPSGEDENEGALDRLIQSLKNGKVKHRRRRPTDAANISLSSEPDVNDSTYNARDMLAQLKAGGFIAPSSPTISSFTQQRRRRRRTERGFDNGGEPLSPPTAESAESLVPEDTDSASEIADNAGEESTEDSLDLSYFVSAVL